VVITASFVVLSARVSIVPSASTHLRDTYVRFFTVQIKISVAVNLRYLDNYVKFYDEIHNIIVLIRPTASTP